jgi:hypothetical protein
MLTRLIPLLWLAVGATQSLAQQGVVRGRVIDVTAHRAVREAEIVLAEAGRTVRADSAGRFEFRGVRSGPITLRVRALGYGSQVVTFDLAAGQEVQRIITLEQAVQTLGGIDVNAVASSGYRLSGFERRSQTGRGQYMNEQQIRQVNASTVPELLRGLRGILFECGGGAGCYVRMARAPMRCLPDYVVDNQLMNDFGPRTPIGDVVAVEVYSGPGDVAGEFAGSNAGCGVIVLWTRSGPSKRVQSPKRDPDLPL